MLKIAFKLLAGALLAVPCTQAFGDQIYKCGYPDGRLLYQKTPCTAQAETLSAWMQINKTEPSEAADEKPPSIPLSLKQNANGHYYVDGEINGKPINFVIDTGASVVALPKTLASAAGISCEDDALMETANGMTEACTSVIRELKFGHFFVRHVQSMIVPNLSQPLLGMNILQRFKIAQDNGQMRISPE